VDIGACCIMCSLNGNDRPTSNHGDSEKYQTQQLRKETF